MRLLYHIRLALARPFFFMADRFTDGKEHYTKVGDWFYFTGMDIVNRPLERYTVMRVSTVCQKCQHEQPIFQQGGGFPKGTQFSRFGVNERSITCQSCGNVGVWFSIEYNVPAKRIVDRAKHPIGSYRGLYIRRRIPKHSEGQWTG